MSGYGGGISSFIANKAKFFQKSQVIFDIITFDEVPESFNSLIRGTGGEVYRISNPKLEGFKTFYSEVNDIMSDLPIETFVHCHMKGYRAVPFYLIAKKNGLHQFGVHAHTTGLPEQLNQPDFRLMRRVNNAISSVKISCGIEASKYLFGEKYVEQKAIMHIPNSIDPEEYIVERNLDRPDAFANIPKDKYLIGHIGRFNWVKNHDFMLDIIEELKGSTLDFMWVFIGDGELFEEIQAKVNKKGLADNVLLLGRRNDIPELLSFLDCAVLPSLYEGFPTVAVEAQASGTKILLSDRITPEVDLGLDLVEFLSLSEPRVWADYILKNKTTKNVDSEVRLRALEEHKLTNRTSALLYEAFLTGKMTHYEMH